MLRCYNNMSGDSAYINANDQLVTGRKRISTVTEKE